MVDGIVSILMALGSLYLGLYFAKMLLVLGSFSAAVAAFSKARTGKRFDLYSAAVLACTLPVMIFFSMPVALRTEGFRFFSVYSNYGTMRQVLTAYRDAVAMEDTE